MRNSLLALITTFSAVAFVAFLLLPASVLAAEETFCDDPNEVLIALDTRSKPVDRSSLSSEFDMYYKHKRKSGGICIDLEKTKGLTCALAKSFGKDLLGNSFENSYDMNFYANKEQKNLIRNFEFFMQSLACTS